MRSRDYSQRPQTVAVAERPTLGTARSTIPGVLFWPVALTIGSSFYVAVEPAPTDLLFLWLLLAMVVMRGLRFPMDLNPVLTGALFAFIVGSVLSLLASRAFGPAIIYLAVTLYLVLGWYLLVTLLANYGWPMWELILRAFIVAAVLAALTGFISHYSTVLQDYIGLRPTYGVERTRGTFKDPNVYAPFLCAALLLVINQIVAGRWRLIVSAPLLALFSLEILLAFSRGGYVSLAVSLLVLFTITCILWRRPWLTRFAGLIFLASIVIVPTASLYLQSSGLDDFLSRRLALQSYDAERFTAHEMALETVPEAPFGIGPGQTSLLLPISTHNVYLRVILENGVIAALGFILFVAMTLWISLQGAFRRGAFQHIYMCSLAILAGILVNSLVIDSLHWRHFFLFLAIPIGLDRYERWQAPLPAGVSTLAHLSSAGRSPGRTHADRARSGAVPRDERLARHP